MSKSQIYNIIFLLVAVSFVGCKTTKKKSEAGWLSKRWHDMNSKYNAHFNADVLFDEAKLKLEQGNQEIYSDILPVYPEVGSSNPNFISQEMDAIIEKMGRTATVHSVSQWVDDSYVKLGRAYYMKQDYETAEEALVYFYENFDPSDPTSRVFNSKETDPAKLRKRKLKEQREVREIERKKQEEERRLKLEILDKLREEKDKVRDKIAEVRNSQREFIANQREKTREIRDKFRTKKSKNTDQFRKKEEEIQKEIQKIRKDLAETRVDNTKTERERRLEERKKRIETQKKGGKVDYSKDPQAEARQNEALLEQRLTERENALEALRLKYEEQQKKDREQQEKEVAAVDEVAKEKAKDFEKQESVLDEELEKLNPKKEEEEEESGDLAQLDSDTPFDEKSEDDKKKDIKLTNDRFNGKGLFKHRPAYLEGQYWLARTYIERQNYTTAQYLLAELEDNPNVAKKIAKELPALRAHYYIETDQPSKAIPYLEEAIDLTKEKENKARYAYILGQLLEREQNFSEARDAFAIAKQKTSNFELKLNSDLGMIRSDWRSGQKSDDAVISQLDRLANEDKYIDYHDQFYYLMAEVQLEAGNKEEALKTFAKAAESGNPSDARRVETYYNLAMLFYDNNDFVKAKEYFGSTLKSLKKGDFKKREVEYFDNGLTRIAQNDAIYQLQDSLLRLAKLSDDELKEWAESKIEDEEDLAELDEETSEEPVNNKVQYERYSSFFAYNDAIRQSGVIDFKRKWGEVTLQDNWRLSSETVNNVVVSNEEDLKEQIEERDKKNRRNKEIDRLIGEVPRNKQQMDIASNKIEKALYEMGKDLRLELNDPEKSAEIFTELLSNFNDSRYLKDAYYYQYLNYTELGDPQKASRFLSMIETDFPNSTYAKTLADPSFKDDLAEKEAEAEKSYEQAFKLYQTEHYDEALTMANNSVDEFGANHDYATRFDLLGVMAKGALEGKEVYMDGLRGFVARHPKTDEAIRANEILRFLKGDETAFSGNISDEEFSKFVIDEDALHYVVVVLYDKDAKVMRESKISVQAFNSKYHKLDKLRISNSYLNTDDKTQVILIRSFKGKDKAVQYVLGTKENPSDFINGKRIQFDVFAVNQKNYREIIKQKSIKSYQAFHDLYYEE